MERPVVRLEISPLWALWRIYHVWEEPIPRPFHAEEEMNGNEDESSVKGEDGVQDEGPDLNIRWVSMPRSSYIRRGDPLDEKGFDEAASFPSFKPDRDLFGPPGRCRKQRGWHYVKRWPPMAHAMDTIPQEKYATGANIPPEILNNVVKSYLSNPDPDSRSLDWAHRGLGPLRLVCRHWEKLCTINHFRAFTLQNLEDVNNRLAALDKRSAWGWEAYLVLYLHLRLNVAESLCTWIHAAQTKLIPRLPLGPEVTLHIQGPIPAGTRLTSVYQTSPRRSLWHPLWIRNLTLADLHFVKLDDLIRVLRELPFLENMKGSRITWNAEPKAYPRTTSFIPADLASRLRPSAFSPSLTMYNFDDCPHGLAAMIGCALSPSGTSPIAQTDVDLLCALATASNPAEDLSHTAATQRSYRTDGGVYISDGDTVHVGLAPMQSRLQARTVQFVAIDGFDERTGDSSVPIPWEIVADCVEQLVVQPDLFLVFLSPQSAATFRQAVAIPRMARLVSQGRLKYVLEEEGGIKGTWRLVEPDGDGGWRVVATQYPVSKAKDRKCYDPDGLQSTTHLVRKLIAQSLGQ